MNKTELKRYDCQECGRNVDGREYHPYLFCQLQKAGLLDDTLAWHSQAVAERERLLEKRILLQEYPDDVMLWTPDGKERTRVIKTEDVKQAFKALSPKEDFNSPEIGVNRNGGDHA